MRSSNLLRAALVLLAALPACGSSAATGDAGPDAASFGTARPGKRRDQATATDPTSGRLVVFGGDDGPIVAQIPHPIFIDDTWTFDPAAGWAMVPGVTHPSARGRMATAYDPTAGRVLAFGGRFRTTDTTGAYTLYADLWAFDLTGQTWSLITDGGGAGAAPSPRSFAVAAVDGKTGVFYLFGGDTSSDPLTISPSPELWSYDGQAGWRLRTPSGTAPSTRHFMAAAYDAKRNQLVVFGGQVGDFVSPGLDDLYALDLTTLAWTRLADGSGAAPSGRFSARLAYDAARDRYLLFAGHADLGSANDVWAFDPTAKTWTALAAGDQFTGAPLGCLGNATEIPKNYLTQDLTAPEGRSSGSIGVVGDSLWAFGGESDCEDQLDDTWRFGLVDTQWHEAIGATSGESCARRNDACECMCL